MLQFYSIVTEADKRKDIDISDENEGTDYTDLDGGEDVEIESDGTSNNPSDTGESTDYTDLDDEPDTSNEEEGDDFNNENNPDEPKSTDYTDLDEDESNKGEEDTSSDENASDSEENNEQDTNSKNNRILMNDFIKLYFFNKSILTKISDITGNHMVNTVIKQVKSNLVNVSGVIYNHISVDYGDTYVNNLYKYNYFIEIIKLNIEMLKKVNSFETK